MTTRCSNMQKYRDKSVKSTPLTTIKKPTSLHKDTP